VFTLEFETGYTFAIAFDTNVQDSCCNRGTAFEHAPVYTWVVLNSNQSRHIEEDPVPTEPVRSEDCYRSIERTKMRLQDRLAG
jgi:hypothetical protein